MASQRFYPSAYTLGTNGGDFSNPTFMYADDTSYSTNTVTTKNRSALIYLESFGIMSVIPAGSTINSVSIGVHYMMSTTSAPMSISLRAYDGTTAMGSIATDTTEPTTLTTFDSTTVGTWTTDNLANMRVLLTDIRGNGTTACTRSYDFVYVDVDWTPAVTVVSGATTMTGSASETISSEVIQADHWELERKVDSGSWSLYQTLPYATLSYQDTNIPAPHTYWYRVRLYKDLAYGDYSDEQYVEILAPTVVGATVMDGSSTEVVIGTAFAVRTGSFTVNAATNLTSAFTHRIAVSIGTTSASSNITTAFTHRIQMILNLVQPSSTVLNTKHGVVYALPNLSVTATVESIIKKEILRALGTISNVSNATITGGRNVNVALNTISSASNASASFTHRIKMILNLIQASSLNVNFTHNILYALPGLNASTMVGAILRKNIASALSTIIHDTDLATTGGRNTDVSLDPVVLSSLMQISMAHNIRISLSMMILSAFSISKMKHAYANLGILDELTDLAHTGYKNVGWNLDEIDHQTSTNASGLKEAYTAYILSSITEIVSNGLKIASTDIMLVAQELAEVVYAKNSFTDVALMDLVQVDASFYKGVDGTVSLDDLASFSLNAYKQAYLDCAILLVSSLLAEGYSVSIIKAIMHTGAFHDAIVKTGRMNAELERTVNMHGDITAPDSGDEL